MDTKFSVVAAVRVAMMAAATQAAAIRVRNSSITCKPACSACCKRFLLISLAEAAVLVDFLKRHKKWDRVAEVSRHQQSMAMSIKPMAWFKIGLPCPILNQDLCDAYLVRPSTCSAHHVTSPPEACSPLSTSFSSYVPHELTDVHVDFMRSFAAAVCSGSTLRARAPMPVALILAERMSIDPGSDFDGLVATLVREFR